MQYFPAKMDQLAKMLSFIICIVLIIPFYGIFQQASVRHDSRLFIGPACIIFVLLLSVLYQPKGYGLDAEGLHIRRLLNTKTIPLTSILGAEHVVLRDLGFGLRTFAVGGFLGYFGKYWYKEIGHTTFYVTDRDKMILIRMPDHKTLLISPDDLPGFLVALNKLKG